MAKACVWIWNCVIITKLLLDIAAMDKYKRSKCRTGKKTENEKYKKKPFDDFTVCSTA